MATCAQLGGESVDPSGLSVAIVGSRSFPVDMFPAQCIEYLENALRHAGFPIATVISGGADGADRAAAIWAERTGVDPSLGLLALQ